MILFIEMIIGCAFFTVMVILGTKNNPLSGLHNMPIRLQEKVATLPQYKKDKSHTYKRTYS